MSDINNPNSIESAKILTLSTEHLHPATMDALEASEGNLFDGPSIAVRSEGFLMNSHLGTLDTLDMDLRGDDILAAMNSRHPDLVLIRALARGLDAEWVNLDVDGVAYNEFLPIYDDDGVVTPPTADGWKEALSSVGVSHDGNEMIIASRAVLEAIEAGQTPGLKPDENQPEP